VTAIAFRSNAARLLAVLLDAPRLPETQICAECGKKTYATRQGAEYVLYWCRFGTFREKTETHAYYSRDCDWWHLTSKNDDHKTAAERYE
jgi:hypothetical protein